MRILTLAALIAAGPALAGPCITHDAWTGSDKNKHLIGGAAIGAAVVAATGSKTDAVIATIAIAALKEASDRRSPRHTCSLQDFSVTVAGGIAGAYGASFILGPNYIGFIKQF